MGAGGRHWGLLVQKFRVGACAGADGKGSIQNAARLDSQEAEEPGSDQKVLLVEYELIKGEGEGSEPVVPETDLLLEEPEKVKLTGTVTKEELGRSTWTFLHTLATQFPRKPTKQQQRDAKELMAIISRLYPCKTCAEHFKEVLNVYPSLFNDMEKNNSGPWAGMNEESAWDSSTNEAISGARPPKTNSGIEFAEWMCQVHNVVNKSLGKPEYPCEQVDFRWGAFDCDGACDLHAGPPHK